MKHLKDIPFEVQKVWAYQAINQPVGSELYSEFLETIKKYPQYFPWETKYNSLPASIHVAYHDELSQLRHEVYETEEFKICPGEGLMSQMKRHSDFMTEDKKNHPEKYTLTAALQKFNGQQNKEREYKRKRKEIWNKHYSKYGLKFRD